MSEVAATIKPGSNSVLVRWENVSKGHAYETVSFSDYRQMTIHVIGGPVSIMGSHLKDDPAYHITDRHGFVIKAPGIYDVTINPRFVYPRAESDAPATVTIWATK